MKPYFDGMDVIL